MAVKTRVAYSRLFNETKSVLADLERGDVLLERRGEDDLVLTTSSRAAANEAGTNIAARVVQSLATNSPDLLQSVLGNELSWLYWLPKTEMHKCLEDLSGNLAAGLQTGNLVPFGQAMEAWKSTAEVWSDPELAASLRQEFAGDGPEITRPGGQ
jgi:hypothetical protein